MSRIWHWATDYRPGHGRYNPSMTTPLVIVFLMLMGGYALIPPRPTAAPTATPTATPTAPATCHIPIGHNHAAPDVNAPRVCVEGGTPTPYQLAHPCYTDGMGGYGGDYDTSGRFLGNRRFPCGTYMPDN